jgi:hypothetical protein
MPMHEGRLICAQLMDFIPKRDFDDSVNRYRGNYRVRDFSCHDQFLAMAFAPLTYGESLRDIETCLNAVPPKLYHAGFRGKVARSTLGDANKRRDGRIYAKKKLDYCRRESRVVDTTTGLRSDQTIVFQGPKTSHLYPAPLRRVAYYDAEHDRRLVFLTNNFELSALTIAQLYRCRGRVELSFKWIKQNLRIKAFYGNSVNALKTQVWIAVSVYVLVAILKKELKLNRSLIEILQILSVTPFEKTPIFQALSTSAVPNLETPCCNPLSLFNL